jgi:uncharacterized MAPEG superfamily protein
MTPEMKYLSYITVLTALMWIPYILNVLMRNRLSDAVGYPDAPLVMAPWAERLKKAHYNAIENLVIFATLILIANAMELSNAATTSAAAVYFWARVVHVVAYGAGIPWVRTLAFAAAWLSILCIAWQVLLLTHT